MPKSIFSRLWNALARWRRRRAAVRELSGLNDHLLRDIGIERCEIRHAVSRLSAARAPLPDDRTAHPAVLLLRPVIGERAAR